jgi:hypothetical protein
VLLVGFDFGIEITVADQDLSRKSVKLSPAEHCENHNSSRDHQREALGSLVSFATPSAKVRCAISKPEPASLARSCPGGPFLPLAMLARDSRALRGEARRNARSRPQNPV